MYGYDENREPAVRVQQTLECPPKLDILGEGLVQSSVLYNYILLVLVKTFVMIIYHDFLPTPRRGSHVKSDKTHTQSSRYTP